MFRHARTVSRVFLPRSNDFHFENGQPLSIAAQSAEKFALSDYPTHQGYFAAEVLQLLGFNTAKTRVVADCEHRTAVRQLDNFIPMSKIATHIQWDKMILNQGSISFKISDQAVLFPLLAKLVGNFDFFYQHGNFGLIQHNNRVYAAAACLSGSQFLRSNPPTPDDVTVAVEVMRRNTSLRWANEDQILHFIARLEMALRNDETGKCQIDRIFNNSRVNNTPELAAVAAEACRLLKLRARAMIDSFLSFKPTCLDEYQDRERLRIQIVEHALRYFTDVNKAERARLLQLNVEDLRGPNTLFVNHTISEADTESKTLLELVKKSISCDITPINMEKEKRLTLRA